MDTENLDVTLTIEGVEVNFIEALEALDAHMEQKTLEKAKELLDERLGDDMAQLDETLSQVKQTLEKFLTTTEKSGKVVT